MAFSSELKREREMGEEELLACPFLKMAPFLMVFFFFFFGTRRWRSGKRNARRCRIGCPKESGVSQGVCYMHSKEGEMLFNLKFGGQRVGLKKEMGSCAIMGMH